MSTPNTSRMPYFVGIAGMVGGFGSWVLATVIGPEPLIDNLPLAIAGYMFLGTLAGLLGVFLIAKTDPQAPAHALAFALACGIFWSPVIASVQALVVRQEVQERQQQVAIKEEQVQQRQQQVAIEEQRLDSERSRLSDLTVDLQQQLSTMETQRRELQQLRENALEDPPGRSLNEARMQRLRELNLAEDQSLNQTSRQLQEIRRNLSATRRNDG